TVVWVHGGAYIGGRKDEAAPYFERLAAAGFTVVSVEYARAPRARYPVAVGQVNRAIAAVLARNERYHVDCRRVILAGDSAGAQIASQIATLTTNPEYAREVGIVPSLSSAQLCGTVLFGGVYDGNAVVRHDGAFANAALQLFIGNVLWAYTGEKGRASTAMRQMSTIDHATSAFPPTFISGGNADPFTSVHSKPFAARLASLGVDVSPAFFADDHDPALPHQFQFDVATDEGAASMAAVVAFVKQRTA
ncbi:MAG TPA: alpha/beta hydrolase, partial [Acidimicrobiia bacterium]